MEIDGMRCMWGRVWVGGWLCVEGLFGGSEISCWGFSLALGKRFVGRRSQGEKKKHELSRWVYVKCLCFLSLATNNNREQGGARWLSNFLRRRGAIRSRETCYFIFPYDSRFSLEISRSLDEGMEEEGG